MKPRSDEAAGSKSGIRMKPILSPPDRNVPEKNTPFRLDTKLDGILNTGSAAPKPFKFKIWLVRWRSSSSSGSLVGVKDFTAAADLTPVDLGVGTGPFDSRGRPV